MTREVCSWALVCALFCGCTRGRAPDAEAAELSRDAATVDAGAAEAGTQAGDKAKAEARKVKEHKSGDWTPGLTEDEKATLFAIARDVLEWSVKGRKGQVDMSAYTVTEKLKADCATFVTFKNGPMLRGGIGCLVAREPMYMSVKTSAQNASRDSRFRLNPITEKELPEIDIHVSLLSPMEPIKSLDEFKIGAHGIVIEKGGLGAVYLPEVAVEQKWTKEQTLSSLSRKAGLRADAWRKGAKFKIFSSVVLSEE